MRDYFFLKKSEFSLFQKKVVSHKKKCSSHKKNSTILRKSRKISLKKILRPRNKIRNPFPPAYAERKRSLILLQLYNELGPTIPNHNSLATNTREKRKFKNYELPRKRGNFLVFELPKVLTSMEYSVFQTKAMITIDLG